MNMRWYNPCVYCFETYAYIVTMTRADRAAFSIQETEYESGLSDVTKERELCSRFLGSAFDTKSLLPFWF